MPRLPDVLDSFVGRDKELNDIGALLRRRSTRLLTLTGAGGVGKTRLALEYARQHAAGGTPVLVELAGLAEDADPAHTVATALGVGERDGHTGATGLAHALGGHRVLLLMDNCEHVIDSCARLITFLLERCPQLRVLATSRETLRVPGEVVLRIGALEVNPGEGGPTENGQAPAGSASDAVRLFTDRAAASAPGLRLTNEDAATVGEICRRLDGMPLAIELAARRTATMPLQTILAGLDDQLALLASGSRTGPARHIDLTAAIDWSHRLLQEPEKALLRRVSLLRGGFDPDSAAAVAADGPDGILPARRILPLLLDLEAKSLIVRTTTANPPQASTAGGGVANAADVNPGRLRFRQLEAVRAYARERLEESGEAEETQRRAVAWLTALVDPVPDAIYWALPVGPALDEQDNLAATIAALPGLVGAPNGPSPLLVYALAYVRCQQGQLTAAGTLLDAGADWPDRRLQTARLTLTALIAFHQVDTKRGFHFAEQAVALARCLGDPVQLARSHDARGHARLVRREFSQAVEDYRACAAALAPLNLLVEAAIAHQNLAWGLHHAGCPAEANAVVTASLPVLRERMPAPALVDILHTAGAVQLAHEDWTGARELFTEALQTLPTQAQRGLDVVEGLAAAFTAQGEHQRAVRLFTAAATIQARLESESEPCWQDQIAPFRAAATAALPRTARSTAQVSGRNLSWTQLVAYALGETPKSPPQGSRTGPLGPLTAREREVADLVAEGLTNQQIGARLKVAPSTIATHLNRIRDKLDLRTRTQITHWLAQQTAHGPMLQNQIAA